MTNRDLEVTNRQSIDNKLKVLIEHMQETNIHALVKELSGRQVRLYNKSWITPAIVISVTEMQKVLNAHLKRDTAEDKKIFKKMKSH